MHNEQIFTPTPIVKLILDEVGYTIGNIRHKHIIDNSCGEGAFLIEIIDRYIKECKRDNVSDKEIICELEEYIHGVEIDCNLANKVCENLDEVLIKNKLFNENSLSIEKEKLPLPYYVNWSIYCIDSFEPIVMEMFKGKMDFVVGNPPYCKVQHLGDKYSIVKSFSFASEGASDLYLAFYNIGCEMLSDKGKLAYIAPNSWMKGVTGKNFRNYLKETKKLDKIIQCGGERIFKDATTFTAITIIDNSKTDINFRYSFYNNKNEEHIGNLNNLILDDGIYLTDEKTVNIIKKMKSVNNLDKNYIVKNGFATLNDKLFVIKNNLYEKNIANIIKVIKASTSEEFSIIYPYDNNSKAIEFNKLNSEVQNILKENAVKNNTDITKTNWYLYGRTQALNDVKFKKITINNIIKNKNDIKINFARENEGVYSGLYVISDDERTLPLVEVFLKTDDFINYVKTLGKYKNGGYYTFSSKDLEQYLNYCFINNF